MSYVTEGNTAVLGMKNLSASPLPDQGVKRSEEFAILVDVSSCSGCKACENACIAWHKLNPPIATEAELVKAGFSFQSTPDLASNIYMMMTFKEAQTDKGFNWFITKKQCMHCSDPGCLKACPAPGAIVQYTNGVVDIDQSKCIGCKNCRTACPFDIPRFDGNNKPFKCNFCLDRVSNGMIPACAKTCSVGALHFGARSEMIDRGNKIVARLKTRGFDKAMLYNPEKVGGTGYVYVLPHGDDPTQYANLPKDPAISPMTTLWKGPLKILAGVAMLATVAALLTHYVTAGPKDVDDHGKEK